MADTKISDLAADSSVGGAEELPANDAGTTKKITVTQIKDFVVDEIEAITAGTGVDGDDQIYILDDTDSALKPVDIDTVLQHIVDAMWGKVAETSPDDADVMVLKDGGTTEKTVTLAYLAAYVLDTIEGDILDVSDLTAHASLADADMFLVTSGTTGKKCTYAVLEAAVQAAFAAYVTALDAVVSPTGSDVFYVLQGGIEKKITLTQIQGETGDVIAPATMTENSVPQWSSAQDTLKDGLTVQAAVRADATAVDTALTTEKAVRDLEKSLVFDQTAIGAALVDVDLIIVDDGAAGTAQRNAPLSALWTWIQTSIQGLTNKVTPVGADVMTIQDSAASSVLKELTLTNHKTWLDTTDMALSRYKLMWVAGQRGKVGINADILNAAEATRMVTDPDFELLGTNAVSTDVTFNPEGGLVLETVGADGDEDILVPHLDANQSAWKQVTWGTDQSVRWECRIRTGANITNCIIWAGLKLTNTEVTITDDDQAFFRYEDDINSGEWEAVSSIGGTDDSHDTGVVVAINTEYHLVIDIQSNRTAKFYINGTLVETSAVLTDAIDLIPYIGVAADGASAAKSLTVRGQAIIRDFA